MLTLPYALNGVYDECSVRHKSVHRRPENGEHRPEQLGAAALLYDLRPTRGYIGAVANVRHGLYGAFCGGFPLYRLVEQGPPVCRFPG